MARWWSFIALTCAANETIGMSTMTPDKAERVQIGTLVRCEYQGERCGMVIGRFHSPVTGDRCFKLLIDDGTVIQNHYSWCQVYVP